MATSKKIYDKEKSPLYRLGSKKYLATKILNVPMERLKDLLSRINTPNYLYSGKKGISYLDNGKAHQLNSYVLSIDISNFYKSTNKEYIFRFFHHYMEVLNNESKKN